VALDLDCVLELDYPNVAPLIEVELKKGLASKQKEDIFAIITSVVGTLSLSLFF
jgi:hypothetical protein